MPDTEVVLEGSWPGTFYSYKIPVNGGDASPEALTYDQRTRCRELPGRLPRLRQPSSREAGFAAGPEGSGPQPARRGASRSSSQVALP